MPAFVIYVVFPLYAFLSFGFVVYGIVLGLRSVPTTYDILAEAERIASARWNADTSEKVSE